MVDGGLALELDRRSDICASARQLLCNRLAKHGALALRISGKL